MDNFQLADGIYAAALTPMREDLSCDHAAFAAHCKDLLSRGCKGVVACGTTGEAPSFSVEERIEILENLIASGFDPSHLLATNAGSNIPDTVRFARAFLKIGCRVLLIAPPTYYKHVSEEGVIAFYKQVIERVGDQRLKVLLYHIPQYTGVPITIPIVEALLSETVIGIKESEGNLAFTHALLTQLPKFKVFVGKETHISEAVHAGAAGAICGVANLYPELICSLCQGGGHPPQQLIGFFRAIQGLPFISAMKAIMQERKGMNWGRLRPPLIPLDDEQKQALFTLLKKEMGE